MLLYQKPIIGIKYNKPTIYIIRDTGEGDGKFKRYKIPIRQLTKDTPFPRASSAFIAAGLLNSHANCLENVNLSQIVRLVVKIRQFNAFSPSVSRRCAAALFLLNLSSSSNDEEYIENLTDVSSLSTIKPDPATKDEQDQKLQAARSLPSINSSRGSLEPLNKVPIVPIFPLADYPKQLVSLKSSDDINERPGGVYNSKSSMIHDSDLDGSKDDLNDGLLESKNECTSENTAAAKSEECGQDEIHAEEAKKQEDHQTVSASTGNESSNIVAPISLEYSDNEEEWEAEDVESLDLSDHDDNVAEAQSTTIPAKSKSLKDNFFGDEPEATEDEIKQDIIECSSTDPVDVTNKFQDDQTLATGNESASTVAPASLEYSDNEEEWEAEDVESLDLSDHDDNVAHAHSTAIPVESTKSKSLTDNFFGDEPDAAQDETRPFGSQEDSIEYSDNEADPSAEQRGEDVARGGSLDHVTSAAEKEYMIDDFAGDTDDEELEEIIVEDFIDDGDISYGSSSDKEGENDDDAF